ncbi:hypothetical protein [Psychrobacillus sp.]|uniref:hypothetical protein n=1 Tax=Psychrobacillus sp. TaxID=1871623 RepID=UPI0028BDFBD5|nr:hypothetical protein [Psychrobacillus sp.]
MEEELSVLLEKILSEHPKEKVVAALNILAGLSHNELQDIAKIAQELDETTNH